MRAYFLTIVCCVLCNIGKAQTLGGNAVYGFLKMPNTAQLSALGGVNVSVPSKDVGMAFQNPALLRNEMHQQVNTSFNAFVAGIANYSITAAWHLPAAKTNIGVGINYFNYGDLSQTDAAGNIAGTFRPRDYVVQIMAARQYKENWWYGATIKLIRSEYGQYRSTGIASDIGISYHHTEGQWQASLVIKNIGTQLSSYESGGTKEELPFDIQAGITKKLKNAPVQFSFSLHQLTRFNQVYNDTGFLAQEGRESTNSSTFQKIAGHIVLGAQCFVTDKFSISTGYNFQRRQDLNGFNIANGLNGFSFGTGLILPRLQFRYATGFYQRNLFHQFSLNFYWKGNE